MGPLDNYFCEPADYRTDWWEADWHKEQLLQLYYIGLAALASFVFVVDIGFDMFV